MMWRQWKLISKTAHVDLKSTWHKSHRYWLNHFWLDGFIWWDNIPYPFLNVYIQCNVVVSQIEYYENKITERQVSSYSKAINVLQEQLNSLRPSGAYICVSKLTIIDSDNGLSPGRRQSIIWTNAGILIRTLRTNFTEILIKISTFSFKQMHSKILSAKWRPFGLGLNVLEYCMFRLC